MKLFAFAGVRPNFVKLQALFDANRRRKSTLQAQIEVLQVTQHYDASLSRDIGASYWQHVVARLETGQGGEPACLSTAIYQNAQRWLRGHASPSDWVVVIGDAEATLASALAASNLGLPLCHIEAGMRMPLDFGPEAVIARATDCVAALRLAASQRTFAQLQKERLNGSHFVGDLYLDLVHAWQKTRPSPTPRARRQVVIALHHLPNHERYHQLVEGITRAVRRRGMESIIVEHPKYRSAEHRSYVQRADRVVAAVTHAEMLGLVNDARCVVTDSGGLQRESYYLGRRCLVPSATCWWPELVDVGGTVCVGENLEQLEAGLSWAEDPCRFSAGDGAFGDGMAGTKILDILFSLR
ncbi:UDP-N-acetylglucosamine 2-epimerase [Actinoallomurus sp. CA-150999]|uniref:UDP-N-acetylglucosamine 2-epimerase n=1 Tax=Actinoallomurus sp. CA-150999 TaxID=3239887 RepID=UPI003D928EA0